MYVSDNATVEAAFSEYALKDQQRVDAEKAQPKPCTCGIPNKANHHVSVVIGRSVEGGTETSEVDIYVCSAHMTDDTRSLFRFDNADQWEILEEKSIELR